jgi:hypothetical protein
MGAIGTVIALWKLSLGATVMHIPARPARGLALLWTVIKVWSAVCHVSGFRTWRRHGALTAAITNGHGVYE